MHVKASGSYSTVSDVWAKVSGTWTRCTMAAVKITQYMYYTWAINWAVSFYKWVNSSGSFFSVISSTESEFAFVLKSGTGIGFPANTYRVQFSFTTGNAPYCVSTKIGSTLTCVYDGQVISNEGSHLHYSANTSYSFDRNVTTTNNNGFIVRFYNYPNDATLRYDSITINVVS